MKKRYYKWYVRTFRFNEKIDRKFTNLGKTVFLCAFALIFFGLNTRLSMLFVFFAAAVGLMIADLISLCFLKEKYEFTRFLPECVAKGVTLKYSVLLRVIDPIKRDEALFYEEIPADPVPSFDLLYAAREPGEEKRNSFDRKMGYYRWKWLIAKNKGGKYAENVAAGREVDGGIMFNAEFLPERRGRIKFGGAYIFRKGIFGLFKKGRIVEGAGSFIVLPEMKGEIDVPEMNGGAVIGNNEKTRETQETGSGYELKSLREFVPGDSLRRVHWKSSAKNGRLMTKEFYKEVDAGTVVFIDSFLTGYYPEDFEKMLSAAASLLDSLQKDDALPQFIVAGKEVLDLPDSSKKSYASALSMLALVENNINYDFDKSLDLLMECAESSSAVLFFTAKYDKMRYDALQSLAGKNVQTVLFYSGEAECSGAVPCEVKIDL